MEDRYLVRNLGVALSSQPDPLTALCAKLRISRETIEDWEIRRRALDARQSGRIRYDYTLSVRFAGEPPIHPDLHPEAPAPTEPLPQRILHDDRPLIVGMGPAGLFAALALVERGFRPIIVDRGDPVSERTARVGRFWGTGELDPESNVQFGEGGAGTFSDGKLTARNRTPHTEAVFDYLIRFGAPPEIAYEALPHLGTDGLVGILANLRAFLESKGAEFRFRSRLDAIDLESGRITGVSIGNERYQPEIVLLGVGNGADDTYRMLHQAGISMESKPFAAGVRIEHPQDYLNRAFYGQDVDLSLTGPATYRLTAKAGERGVYSFCMCPGGMVVAAASEHDGQVLNGMSRQLRDGKYGNSAIVVTVNESDYGRGPLAALEFRRAIETRCFDATLPYHAPTQSAGAFLGVGKRAVGRTSYRPGVRIVELSGLFPPALTKALKQGLATFGRRVRGFVEEGVLLAPETRTSSPVRMIRDEGKFCALGVENLYPIGEGAGYAGGIISSAADGWRTGSLFVPKS
jgi:uncharacterized protein